MTFSQPNAWVADHMRADFDLTGFPPGARVLDIGCGCGKNLDALTQKGVRATGIDPDASAVEYCRHLGLPADVGSAEALPAADASLDGCLLDGVLQFTDVPVALREIHRVLRPGGCVLIATQGTGYALYTMISRRGKGRLFGLRMMVNAAMFRLFGKRFRYFGVLGSRAKMKTLLNSLKKEGFNERLLAEIRTPVGLPINSRTPEEIAVSIAAEIISVKNRR